jgi:hypothetical protein
MYLLERTDRQTWCPYKRECSYFSIPAGGEWRLDSRWPADWRPAVGVDGNPDAPRRRRLATHGSLLLYSAGYAALGKNRKAFA